jgi:hypothetical protein
MMDYELKMIATVYLMFILIGGSIGIGMIVRDVVRYLKG